MKLLDFKPVCGIYKITNMVNRRVYIGQSVNIMYRWAEHVKELHKGTHTNVSLLEDIKKHGLKAFEVELIEKCKKDVLLQREEFYITQYYKDGYKLYNRNSTGMFRAEAKKGWSVGWHTMGNPHEQRKMSEVEFWSYAEAEHCAHSLSVVDPENYYFVVHPDE